MALVSATEMLNKAHEGHYAVGAFNINNLEWTKMILLAAEEAKSPVMLGVSEGAAKYMCGFKTVVAMVKEVHDSLGITVPVALHLDHGSYEGAKACIEAGFTSVMFDGSHYAFEENLAKSKEMIELAHSKGLSIECEVGGIGGEEDGVASMGDQYGFEVTQFESSSDMYQAVLGGEAVACFEDYPVIGYEISRGLGLTLPTPMEKGSSYGFATLKGANPELVEMFNKGLENIKADGTYDKILSTYIAK